MEREQCLLCLTILSLKLGTVYEELNGGGVILQNIMIEDKRGWGLKMTKKVKHLIWIMTPLVPSGGHGIDKNWHWNVLLFSIIS